MRDARRAEVHRLRTPRRHARFGDRCHAVQRRHSRPPQLPATHRARRRGRVDAHAWRRAVRNRRRCAERRQRDQRKEPADDRPQRQARRNGNAAGHPARAPVHTQGDPLQPHAFPRRRRRKLGRDDRARGGRCRTRLDDPRFRPRAAAEDVARQRPRGDAAGEAHLGDAMRGQRPLVLLGQGEDTRLRLEARRHGQPRMGRTCRRWRAAPT